MIITAGKYKGRKIQAPNEQITRPTLSKVRMGVFNSLYSILGDFNDKSLLDIFGGSGIIGLEALSRGFKTVTVFEINKKSASIITKNYEMLGLKPDLKIGNAITLINNLSESYDVIYVDPPYESGYYEKILPGIKTGIIVIEHSLPIDLSCYKILKQKNYGGKLISIVKPC